MKVSNIISAATLVICTAVAAPTYACSTNDGGDPIENGGLLFSHPGLNKNLGCGEHEFVGLNSHYNSSFSDNWKFTVAEDTTASIGVFDLELGFDLPAVPESKNGHKLLQQISSTKIFDTKNLSFSVYDDSGSLLGKAGENETLSGLSLHAGEWYTVTVSGKVAGLLGSAYYGTLETCVTPVPLGDSAPMLGSALALLALGYRKRFTQNT